MAKSDVRRVDGKDRIAELARMLSGAKVTPAALKAATELVEAARPNGGSATAARSEPRASSPARGGG
jgi:hypothetical protein